jgi:hypothetical protein
MLTIRPGEFASVESFIPTLAAKSPSRPDWVHKLLGGVGDRLYLGSEGCKRSGDLELAPGGA